MHSSSTSKCMLSFDPCRASDSGQIYKLMTGIIVPRPIALVSTVDRRWQSPIWRPFSFFAASAPHPPTVLFCPARATPPERKQAGHQKRYAAQRGRDAANS